MVLLSGQEATDNQRPPSNRHESDPWVEVCNQGSSPFWVMNGLMAKNMEIIVSHQIYPLSPT